MTAGPKDRRSPVKPAHRLDGIQYRLDLELAYLSPTSSVGLVVDFDDIDFLLEHVRTLTAERDALRARLRSAERHGERRWNVRTVPVARPSCERIEDLAFTRVGVRRNSPEPVEGGETDG